MTAPALRLTGGHVVTPSGSTAALDVVIDGGTIAALDEPVDERGAAGGAGAIDVSGRLVAPGFIDMQINGGWGDDFTSDPRSIERVARRLPSTGVTAFLPTIVTCPAETRAVALRTIASLDGDPSSAIPLGLHLEGPCISPHRPGAHDPRWIGMPGDEETSTWSRAAGVAMVTLAPECEGAIELVEALARAGVVVSLGHSQCSAEQFADAHRVGAAMVTHLFNAMGPFSHRSPGLVGATLAGDVFAGLICDGIHVDPVAVRMAWNALGPERTILVTDAISALGIDIADTRLGDAPVTVDETGVRTAGGVLAGSTLALDQAVRNLVAFSRCSAADAIRTVTANPAEVLGLRDRGRIECGASADLVVLDHDLRVELTIIGGKVAWKS
jgi:N-acetylglucosamine-6-phosphate deacetylase